uniref:Uncharacterized protein n=1 Tax=Romanomermis culicivorax TaxID=13658 RepID=A0A915L775_ROMCU
MNVEEIDSTERTTIHYQENVMKRHPYKAGFSKLTKICQPKIFCNNFRPAGALSDANLMVPDLLPAAVSLLKEIDVDVNTVTRAMTKKPISQPTLSDHMLLAADYVLPNHRLPQGSQTSTGHQPCHHQNCHFPSNNQCSEISSHLFH